MSFFLCLVKVRVISLFLCQFGHFCLCNVGLCRAQFRVCHQSESVQWHGRWPSCVCICAHQGGDGTRTHLTTDPSCGAHGHCSVIHNSCCVLDWYHPVQESGSIIILAYWDTAWISYLAAVSGGSVVSKPVFWGPPILSSSSGNLLSSLMQWSLKCWFSHHSITWYGC